MSDKDKQNNDDIISTAEEAPETISDDDLENVDGVGASAGTPSGEVEDADRDYADMLEEDLKIRKFLMGRLRQAGVSKVVIERPAKRARVTIHSARPGVIIGKKGADIERLRQDVSKLAASDVSLNIVEIRKPEIEAKLVADNIAAA